MAKFSFGIDDLTVPLKELGDSMNLVCYEMVDKGGQILKEALKGGFESSIGFSLQEEARSTGGLIKSIKLRKPKRNKRTAVWESVIYFYGKAPKSEKPRNKHTEAQRYGKIAYVLEYGAPNKGIDPRPTIRMTTKSNESAIVKVMTEVFEEHLENIKLN